MRLNQRAGNEAARLDPLGTLAVRVKAVSMPRCLCVRSKNDALTSGSLSTQMSTDRPRYESRGSSTSDSGESIVWCNAVDPPLRHRMPPGTKTGSQGGVAQAVPASHTAFPKQVSLALTAPTLDSVPLCLFDNPTIDRRFTKRPCLRLALRL